MMEDKRFQLSISFRWLQALLWVVFFLALMVYTFNKYGFTYSLYGAFIAVTAYLLAVYGNSSVLMPKYFKKGRIRVYIICSLSFIAVIVALKVWLEYKLLLPYHKVFFNLQLPHISLGFLTIITAFLFGGFLHTAKNYIGLLKQQEEMKSQQLVTELNLLKQQVQPHFLFNTLNNIYSMANAKSDNTKIAIARLADIMRYFTEDAPKEKVDLQTEINFINNYISLEQLRMVHPVHIEADFGQQHIQLPTMLLMPFVENLFKHGVDKTKNDNEAILKLYIENGRLHYSVKNRLFPELTNGSGFGLANLRKRLHLLYDNNYRLETKKNGLYFESYMEIPV